MPDHSLADLLSTVGRERLPPGWTGGAAERDGGQLTRQFATDDDRQVVFYAVREGGPATLHRARWDDDHGEYVVGPDLAERADGSTDPALFRAALELMTGGSSGDGEP